MSPSRFRFEADDRGVSIAVTHVLTIGITAVLITGLLFGASTLLESERERGAQGSLETIGERLAGEIASVDRMATNETGTVTLRVDHPRRVSGSAYSIELGEGDDCSWALLNDTSHCLILTAHREDVTAWIPVTIDEASGFETDSSVRGGPITITYDGTAGTIRIESGH